MNDFTIIDDKSTTAIISIAMLTYNHEKYIAQTLDSVLMQNVNFDYQIVIADDFSTDKTRDIILRYKDKHPNKFKLIFQNKNVGASVNNLNLLTNINSPYIAALEGDDYWTDSLKLQKQVDFLENHPEYVMCFHKVKILKRNGALVPDFITKVPVDYQLRKNLAKYGNYIHTPSVVFRNVIKTFPDEFLLSPIGDYFLYMLLTEHGKIYCIQEEMAVYRFGVGYFSGIQHKKKLKGSVDCLVLLYSAIENIEIKSLIYERYLATSEELYNYKRKKINLNVISILHAKYLRYKTRYFS